MSEVANAALVALYLTAAVIALWTMGAILVEGLRRLWRARNPPEAPRPAPDDLSPGTVHTVPGTWVPVETCFHADSYTEEDFQRMRREVVKMINPPLVNVEPTEEEWRGVKS